MNHTFEIRDAKPWHVGQMARMIRKDQRNAIVKIGVSPHQELSKIFNSSSFKKVCLVDGKLQAMWGVVGTLISSSGFVWMVVTDEAMRFPVKMVKETRNQLRIISEITPKLFTALVDGDEVAIKFAKYFGFSSANIGYDPGEGFVGMTYSPEEKQSYSPFIVLGLPRSRTKWLSTLLTFGKFTCHHDLPVSVKSFTEIKNILSKNNNGVVDTGLACGIWSILKEFPKSRIVVIRRNWADVQKSASNIGWEIEENYLRWQEDNLKTISLIPGVLTINFDELNNFDKCSELFLYCLGQSLPDFWWEKLKDENIQIDIQERFSAIEKNKDNLVGIFNEIGNTITIQKECLDTFMKDSAQLRQAHFEEAWREEDDVFRPNISMLYNLETSGNLRITTARKGTEMIGYLFHIISPVLENDGILAAYQNTFFVKKEYRGLVGPMMRKAAKKELLLRGVDHLILKSGIRADGPRLAKMYEHEGAEFVGSLYRLQLEN